MYLDSRSFRPYDWLAERFAFCAADPQTHMRRAANVSPHLVWGDVPAHTRSFALACYDPDVPSRGDDVNQADKTVPIELTRVTFWHWLLADLPADLRTLAEGDGGSGVFERGKPASHANIGLAGANDYTSWFASDPAMSGTYTGYDGPAPPFNDLRVHGYVFEIFALDTPSLGLTPGFRPDAFEQALKFHVLDSARITALFSTNPEARRLFLGP